MHKSIFAIDVGGVLASKQHDGEPTIYSLESIQYLSNFFDCWIVSMCGKQRALQTRMWLFREGFERFIPPAKQIYIPFSAGNKNEVLKDINARFFIDDREKHLKPAAELVSLDCVYKFDPSTLPNRDNPWVMVPDWLALTTDLLMWADRNRC